MKSVVKDVNTASLRASSIESSKNSIIPVLNVSTAIPPQSPALKGNLVYDIITDQIWFGNGSSWAQISTGGGGGTPSGPAGGVLAGTYPNPVLAPGAVTSGALAPGAVTSGALAPGAVTSSALAPGAVTSGALAPGAVTSAALTPGSVTTPILSDTTVIPNTYGNSTTVPQITVDQKGRITGITPVAITAGGTGTVTNIATTVGQLTGGPITTTGTLGLADTAVVPNTYGNATTIPQISVDQKGRITGVTPVAITAGSVTNIATTAGQLTGGPITTTGTLGLADTAVVPNTYGNATTIPQISVDQKGRITGVTPVAISAGSVTNIATTVGQLTGGPITTTGTLGLADTAVVPNTYGNSTTVPQFTVDQKGRITGVTPVAISGVGGPPTGPAGGSLSGTYPNPTIASGSVTTLELAAGQNGSVLYYDGDIIPASWSNSIALTPASNGQCIVAGVRAHPSGDIIISGYFQQSLTFSGAGTLVAPALGDAFVARMTPAGSFVWAVQANSDGAAFVSGNACDVDNAGNIYVHISMSPGGTITPAGIGALTSTYSQRPFIGKLDSTGVWQWVTGATAGASQVVAAQNSIATNPVTGDTYFGGYFNNTVTFNGVIVPAGNQDIFVAKINNAGVWQTQMRGGGSSADTNYSGIAVDSSGNVLVAIKYFGASTFGPAAPSATVISPPAGQNNIGVAYLGVLKLDSNLVPLWVRGGQTSSSGNTLNEAISTDSSDSVYVAGTYETSITWPGQPTLNSSGFQDMTIAKFDSAGNVVWSQTTTNGASGNEIPGAGGLRTLPNGDTYVSLLSNSSEAVGFGTLSIVNPSATGRHVVGKLNSAGVWQYVLNGGTINSGGNSGIDVISGFVYSGASFSGSATYVPNPVIPGNASITSAIAVLEEPAVGTPQWRTDVLKCEAVTPAVGLFDVTLNTAPRQIEAHTTLFAIDAGAGTRSLTSTAARYIRYNNATQVNLPDCSTVTPGFTIEIFMNSASSLPVHISTGSGLVTTVAPNCSAQFTCISATNATTSWLVASASPVYCGREIVTASVAASYTTAVAPETIAWTVTSASTPSITVSGAGIFTVNFPGVYQTTLSFVCNAGSAGTAIINYSSGETSQYIQFDPATIATSSGTHTQALTGGTTIRAQILQAPRTILGGTPAYSSMQIVRLS